MRFLPLISLVLFSACSTLYSGLPKSAGNADCLKRFKPVFSSALYKAEIDVTGKHLSGLLVIKKMPDSSTRAVFSNEMGVTFFDFQFLQNGSFTVFRIMKQLNKKPVIKTLRKDFELVFMECVRSAPAYSLKDERYTYQAYPQRSGVYYYVTDSACTRLVKMQRASKRKVVMEAIMQDQDHGSPDTIGISHKNFNFDIGLKKIRG